jgi:hypothetical protein
VKFWVHFSDETPDFEALLHRFFTLLKSGDAENSSKSDSQLGHEVLNELQGAEGGKRYVEFRGEGAPVLEAEFGQFSSEEEFVAALTTIICAILAEQGNEAVFCNSEHWI